MGIGYTLDGKTLEVAPGKKTRTLHGLSNLPLLTSALVSDWPRIEVEYKTFAGWNTNISDIRSYAELPAPCRAYVEFIQVRPKPWCSKEPTLVRLR